MALWMVRAGRNGEQEDLALAQGMAVIGWDQIPDLAGIGSREELKDLYIELEPDQSINRINNWVSQIWAFGKRMEKGDQVALPLKRRGTVAFGEVTGPYHHRPDNPEGAKHTRSVKWIKTEVQRSSLDQDILDSLGAIMTVCSISRNNIESRVLAMLKDQPPPPATQQPTIDNEGEGASETGAPLDVEQYSRDEIRGFIGRKFRGHELARLVNELLKTQGYQTRMSPPGADGGVDIIAGRGPLGFDQPRLCVQVKSGDDPVGTNIVRELQGVVNNFGANHGLFVSWGGFKPTVFREFRERYFEIRFWDGEELVERLLENYEQLSEDVQAELPLKRVWTLVPEE